MNTASFFNTIKIITQIFVAYFVVGLVFGFIGIQLACRHPLYSCETVGQYLTDPWLFVNTLFWPFTLLHGLDKANIV